MRYGKFGGLGIALAALGATAAIAGTVHYGVDFDKEKAAAKANAEAEKRGLSRGTCYQPADLGSCRKELLRGKWATRSKYDPKTGKWKKVQLSGWICSATSADRRGSCNKPTWIHLNP